MPKPNLMNEDGKQFAHMIEFSDQLPAKHVEVFGTVDGEMALPRLFRIKGCEFGKSYAIIVRSSKADG